MSAEPVDAIVVGAGCAGSLMSMLLARIGWRVVLMDRGRHPRFAIGESTTPAADLVLRHLGERYGLPELVALSSYGRWRAQHAELVCGPKRGFSYFRHEPGRPFEATAEHDTELLVAASTDEPSADLHWLREDVDAFLCQRAAAAGARVFEGTLIHGVHRSRATWSVEAESAAEGILHLEAGLLFDASGRAGALAPWLGYEDHTDSLRTNTRSVFAHFDEVSTWADVLDDLGAPRTDHPFPCDAAAVHHLFDDGWMWQLRFDDGTTSAGFVFDNGCRPPRADTSAAREWEDSLRDLPSLATQFSCARVVRPDDGIRRVDRVQFRRSPVVGAGWALLPNTAGFVDPLHSTGIAHSVVGTARIVRRLEGTSTRDERERTLAIHGSEMERELEFLDELVAGCYANLGTSFFAATMPYFVAATRWESAFLETGDVGVFLDAANESFRSAARSSLRSIFERRIPDAFEQLRATDVVGVLDTDIRHMHSRSATKP